MELCKFLWGNPCTAVEPFSHLGFCLQDSWFSMHFFTFCCIEYPGEGFGCVNFARFACDLRAPRQLLLGFEAHPEAITFPPVCALWQQPRASTRGRPLPATPFQCPRSRTATLELGAAALTCPCVGLSPQWAVCVQYDQPVTQSIATPESSSRTISTIWSPARALSVSPHPGADGLVQGELPPIPPEFWPFSPALPGTLAHPFPPPITAGLGRDRTTWRPLTLAGSLVPPPCATHWRYCHADQTVPRQDVHSPFSPYVCHSRHKVFAHTQVRDPCESAARTCLGDPISLAILIVSETTIVSFWTLPVGFPLPTISQTSLFTLFYPLILYHGACFKSSISGFKVLLSQNLLDTSFYHRLQSVIIRSYFLLMNLQVVQFQYGLEFLRLSYSKFVQAFQDVIRCDLRYR